MMNKKKSIIQFFSILKINSSRNKISSEEIEITSVETLQRFLLY